MKDNLILALLGKAGAAAPKKTANAHVALQPLSDSRREELSSRLESQANSQSSVPSSGSKDTQPLYTQVVPDNDSEKENSQESVVKGKPVMAPPPDDEARPTTEDEQVELHMSPILAPERNPFEGMKRIPRSYVRIPKDQQALLEQKDSWYKPESAGRPYASIPATVLRDIQDHVDRNHKNLELDGINKTPPSVKEEESDVDAETDVDDEAIVDNTEYSTRRLREESVSSDVESYVTWPESEHGNMELEGKEPAPQSSPPQGSNRGIPTISASQDETDSPSSAVYNKPRPIKPAHKIQYDFPTSSPGDEEDMELAVPYAIDDEVTVDDRPIRENLEASQNLPSTAVQTKPVVQVEQTPDHYSRELNIQRNAKQSDPHIGAQHNRDLINGNDEISSDPIIPATFHEASSQPHLPTSIRFFPTSSSVPHSTASSTSEKLRALREEQFVTMQIKSDEEGELAKSQLITELKSSQAFNSPSQPISSSNTALTKVRGNNLSVTEISPSILRHTEHEEKSFPANGQKSNWRPPRRFPTTLSSQEDIDARNVEEMARANRNNFHARWSSPVDELPTVQIAQSPAKVNTPEDLASVRIVGSESLPHSSEEFIQSSVLQTAAKDGNSELSEERTTATEIDSQQQSTVPGKEELISTGSPSDVLIREIDEVVSQDSSLFVQSLPNGKLSNILSSSEKAPKITEHLQRELLSISSDSENEFEGEALDGQVLEIEGGMSDNLMLGGEVDSLLETDEEAQRQSTKEHSEKESPRVLMGLMQDEEKIVEAGSALFMSAFRETSVSTKSTAFQTFKNNYPLYGGTEKEFVWALVYIEWLGHNKGEDFLRASLWDDFIRTLAAEFPEYVRNAKKAKLPMDKIKTGFAYFNNLDKPPIFQDRIITPDSLEEWLVSLKGEEREAVDEIRRKFRQKSSSVGEPSQPESSRRTPSAATDSETHVRRRNLFAPSMAVSNFSEPDVFLDPMSLEGATRATKPRFFETLSQLPIAKRQRGSSHSTAQEDEAETSTSSNGKKQRFLPWQQSSAASPADNRHVPTSSSRGAVKPSNSRPKENVPWEPRSAKGSIAKESAARSPSESFQGLIPTFKSKEAQRTKSSISFTGSPASPILGQAEPVTRSVSTIDSTSTISGPRSTLKPPSSPRSSSMYQATSRSDNNGQVQGWLGQRPASSTHQASRSTSLKQKRHSASASFDAPAVSELKRRKTMPAATIASSSMEPKKELTSYEIFLKNKKERERRESGGTSTAGSARGVRKKKTVHSEPETQAWNS